MKNESLLYFIVHTRPNMGKLVLIITRKNITRCYEPVALAGLSHSEELFMTSTTSNKPSGDRRCIDRSPCRITSTTTPRPPTTLRLKLVIRTMCSTLRTLIIPAIPTLWLLWLRMPIILIPLLILR